MNVLFVFTTWAAVTFYRRTTSKSRRTIYPFVNWFRPQISLPAASAGNWLQTNTVKCVPNQSEWQCVRTDDTRRGGVEQVHQFDDVLRLRHDDQLVVRDRNVYCRVNIIYHFGPVHLSKGIRFDPDLIQVASQSQMLKMPLQSERTRLKLTCAWGCTGATASVHSCSADTVIGLYMRVWFLRSSGAVKICRCKVRYCSNKQTWARFKRASHLPLPVAFRTGSCARHPVRCQHPQFLLGSHLG